jgi:hypothetical protein
MKRTQRTDLFGTVLGLIAGTRGMGVDADQGNCCSDSQQAARGELRHHKENLPALEAR